MKMKKGIQIIVGVLCISLFCVFPQKACSIELGEFSWVDYMLEGNKFLKHGKFEKAIVQLKKAVDKKGNLWDGWFQLAQTYEKLAKSKKENANFFYKQALNSYRQIPYSDTLFFDKVRFHRMRISKIVYGNGRGAILDEEELEWVSNFKKGKDAIANGEYDLAISLLKSVADAKPKLYETYFGVGYAYEKKAEYSTNIYKKVTLLDKAFLEYKKIPRKRPAFSKKLRNIQTRMNTSYKKISSLDIRLGESKEKITSTLGKGQEKISNSHYPIGSVTEIRYDSKGIYLAFRENLVFSIKLGSNYKGIVYGIKINDPIKKINFLYHGKNEGVVGSIKAIRVSDPDVLFIFNDNDNFVDMIELYDTKVYGRWDMKLE